MESEELRLLKENNEMLKLILFYLKTNGSSDLKEFLMNVVANGIVR